MPHALKVCLFAFCCLASALGQDPPPPAISPPPTTQPPEGEAPGAIQGTVLSAATGQALRRIQIDPARVQTNIDITATGLATTDLTAALKPRGVLMNGINPRQMRAVTHFDVSRQQCASAIAAISEALSARR